MDFSSLLKKAENVHKEAQVKKPRKVIAQKSFSFSDEQENFLSSREDKIILSALAGSGKTTLLLNYAKNHPGKKWNFIVFNKQLSLDIEKIAPKNVRVQTLHQLAFAKFGHDLHHKLKDNDLKVNDLHLQELFPFMKNLDKKTCENLSLSLKKGFDYFLNSSLPTPSFECCPYKIWQDITNGKDGFNDKEVWESMIKKIWMLSLSPTHDFPITHDVYLKRFAMSDNPWDGKRWILDEAQDWNDAVLSSLRSSSCFIQAGDPFQCLYKWRGASLDFYNKDNNKEYWLTKSFRSGRGVEDWVNYRLDNLSCPKTWIPASHQMDVVDEKQTPLNIKKFAPSVILSSQWQELELLSKKLIDNKIPFHYPPSSPIKKLKDSDESILLSTIHSAKGLEFDRVWILDEALTGFHSDEMKNILAYVSLTRAINAIRIPSSWPKNENNNLLKAF